MPTEESLADEATKTTPDPAPIIVKVTPGEDITSTLQDAINLAYAQAVRLTEEDLSAGVS